MSRLSFAAVVPLAPRERPPPLFPGAPDYPPGSIVRARSPSMSRSNSHGPSAGRDEGPPAWTTNAMAARAPIPDAGGRGRAPSPSPYSTQQPPPSIHSQQRTQPPLQHPSQYQPNPPAHHQPTQYSSTPSSSTPTTPHSHPDPVALAQAQAAYSHQLVTYYYGYAVKGLLAPVSDARQERARHEAVEWARGQGHQVPGQGQEGYGAGGAGPTQQQYDSRQQQAYPPQAAFPSTFAPQHQQPARGPPTQPQRQPSLPYQQPHIPRASPAAYYHPIPQAAPISHPQPLSRQYSTVAAVQPFQQPSQIYSTPSTSLPTTPQNQQPHFLPLTPHPSLPPTPTPHVLPTPPRPFFPSSPSTPLTRSTSLATSPSQQPRSPAHDIVRASSAAIPETRPLARSTSFAVGKRPLPTPPVRAGTTGGTARPLPTPRDAGRPLPGVGKSAEELLREKMARLGMENDAPATPSFSLSTTVEPPRAPSPSIPVSGSSATPPPHFHTSAPPQPSAPRSPIAPPPPSKRHGNLHPRNDPSHPSHYLYHPTSTPTKLEAGAIACAGCRVQMYGKALMAMGKEWHPDCFRCMKEGCGVRLEHVQFDGKDGEVFCMVHYEELYAQQCYQCETPIAEDDYLTVSDERLVPPGPRTYHALHFFCASCGDPFVDPKSLARGREGTLAAPFMVHKGHAYCQACDMRLWKPKCGGCGKGVGGDYAEAFGKVWHEECFCCLDCRKPLDGPYLVRDYGKGDQAFCNACYDVRAKNED